MALRRFVALLAAAFLVVLAVACGQASPVPGTPQGLEGTAVLPRQMAGEEPVVYVYSSRHYGQVEAAFAEFTKETGIEVRFSFGKDAELRERLKAEGEFTPADVLFTVDAGNLWLAAQEGLLQPVESDVLTQNIPEQWRDPENRWFAFSLRVRTIVYHPDRVDPLELSTYEALADPKWEGRLCLRPSTKTYTQALVANLIHYYGYEKAKEIVAGWARNAAEFIDSDARILKTIAAGGCDVGIVNHYYLARLVREDPHFPVRLFWANQEGEGLDGRGVHANVSGAGVTRHARHVNNAVRLLEWLASEKGMKRFADGNYEFPVNPNLKPHEIVAQWGAFKTDPIPVYLYGELQADAIQLMDEAGYK